MPFKTSFKLVLTVSKWDYVDIPVTGDMDEYCIFIRGRILKVIQKPLENIIYTKELKID